MTGSFNKNAALKRIAGRSLARLMRFVHRTSEIVSEPENAVDALAAGHPLIMASWHGSPMMLPFLRPPGVPVKVLVARHGDGDIMGEAMAQFGVELIRGAGAGGKKRDKGGLHALRGAVRALKDGASVVMTADVPPGPARRAGPGIIMIARLSGCPIVPVAAATSRYKAFDTWSRMTLNLPFSKLAYVAGAPIFVPADADEGMVNACRIRLEKALDQVTLRAFDLAGANPARATPVLDAPGSPPAEPKFLLKAYRVATNVIRPAVPLLLKIREQQGKEDGRRRAERYGEAGAARPEGLLAWFHAASLGETNAILPVMDGLAAARPSLGFLLTTGTVTSAALADRRLGARAIHQYVPLDSPRYARAFLDHWRPDLAVFTESEVWPNLILETAERHVPLALVNARMSKKSFARWRRHRGVAWPLFNRFDIVLAQNEQLARRFGELGARKVITAGNLKIDAPAPEANMKELERLRSALGRRPLFLAASTHEGEERMIAEAHRRLAREIEGLCTIVAPRHPERGTGVAEALKGLGLSVSQRSLGALPDSRSDIYIADTVGELGTLFALSRMAFIGGSLVDKGGQNPIEAVRHDTAVLTGPYWSNFQDAYRALLRHKGAIEVRSAEELAAVVAMLFRDETELARLRAGAMTAVCSMSGALERTLEALLVYLPQNERQRLAV